MWVILIILAALVVLAYVRRQEVWSKPLLVLCVVALIAVVGHRAIVGGGRPVRDRQPSGLEQVAELMGKSLSGRLEPGARIAVFGGFPPDVRTGWLVLRATCETGLAAGLGHTDWELVGYAGTAPGTAATLSQGIDDLGGQIDAVLSFNGLPPDLEQMTIYTRATPPAVAAYFPREADLDLIGKWLSDGLIEGAVVRQNGSLTPYTVAEPP